MNTAEILNFYKRKQARDKLILVPILDSEENTVGFLRPVTADFNVTIPDCVELLNRWRVDNPTLSPSRFPITHERTRRWITDAIIENDKRILFLIQALDGKYIGHMGFTAINPEKNCAEIDLVVRGVKNSAPGLMGQAMGALILWGKQELKLEHIAVMVLWDNVQGIDFYSRCGFKKEEVIPLLKVEKENEISWIPCGNLQGKAEKYYFHMRLF